MSEKTVAQLPEIAVEPLVAYLAAKKKIAALEAEADIHRREVIDLTGTDGAAAGFAWEAPGIGRVEMVKGRTTTTIDRAKLAAQGVDPKVIDNATVTKTGEPTVRITRADE